MQTPISPSVFLVSSRAPRASVEYLRSGWGWRSSHTRAHAHVQRRARGSGTGSICSVNAALLLKEAKRRFQVRSRRAGGRAGGGTARAEMRGWVPEPSAAPEPVPCTHAHTQTHTGTHRAQAPAHLAPGPPRRCRCAARAGVSRVCSLLLPDPDFSYLGLSGWNSVCDCLSLPPGGEVFSVPSPLHP